ncbi:MAG TPA: hypothetical protein VNM89_08075 [Solirubrobacterales bacterium]|nr:hypothetical protein [Solirubrobacterales bacterium]
MFADLGRSRRLGLREWLRRDEQDYEALLGGEAIRKTTLRRT